MFEHWWSKVTGVRSRHRFEHRVDGLHTTAIVCSQDLAEDDILDIQWYSGS